MQTERDRANGLKIDRDVLAIDTVATGRADGKFAVEIDQLDGEAIDFRFDRIFDRLAMLEKTPDAFFEVAQLFFVHCIVERQHGHGVLHGGEFFQGRRADLSRWRVGTGQLGMFLLQFDEPAKKSIVLGVADRGVVKDVVTAIVLFDLSAQFENFSLGALVGGFGHS